MISHSIEALLRVVDVSRIHSSLDDLRRSVKSDDIKMIVDNLIEALDVYASQEESLSKKQKSNLLALVADTHRQLSIYLKSHLHDHEARQVTKCLTTVYVIMLLGGFDNV